MKASDLWYTHFTVLEVFRGTDSLLMADKQKEAACVTDLQRNKGIKQILALGRDLQKRGEAFTRVLQPGTGPGADSSTWIRAIVGARTLKDSILTDNDTVRFKAGHGFFTPAVDGALSGLRNEEIREVRVPAVLIVGAEPLPGNVSVDDTLVFRIRRIE